jgi:hypothetical protein
MGQIVFSIFILCILIYYPQAIIVAGLLLAGSWLYNKYEVVERDSKLAGEKDNEPDFIDPMAKAEKELESKMKKGFRDDPEWKAASKKINDNANIMRSISDLEMKIDELEEERKKKPGPEVDFDLAAAQKQLKTMENQAGITQRRRERTKKKEDPPPKAQAAPIDMTEQEIDAALQELNDL